MVLIQLLLPTRSGEGAILADALFAETRAEVIDKFGGVTAYLRSPASGTWTSPGGEVEEDNVVMIEILAEAFDRDWWRQYVERLQRRFSQQSIHLRATPVETLD